MKRRRLRKAEVDAFLRETFVDDLPQDVREQLRASMRPSWHRATAEGERTRPADAARAPWTWSPQRALLAAAALVALAVGSVIHLEAGASPVAEHFLAQQTATQVVARLHQVSAMSCRLETRDREDRPLQFTIEWQVSGETSVRVESLETTLQRTVHLPRQSPIFLTLARETTTSATRRPDDPVLGPARGYLAPDRIATLLSGRWQSTQALSEGPPGMAVFQVSGPRLPVVLRVTVDARTHLPHSVEQSLPGASPETREGITWARALFVWRLDSGPPRLLQSRRRPGPAWEPSIWS